MSDIIREGSQVTVKAGVMINAQNADSLKRELRQVYEEGASCITIDLAETDAIDSIGLGLLAATHNSLKLRGEKLKLANVKNDLCKVFNLMRLDRHFTISCAGGTEQPDATV